MAVETIGISAAIAALIESPGQEFTMYYMIGDGKDRGKKVLYSRCLLGSPAMRQKGKPSAKVIKVKDASYSDADFKRKYIDKGLLPITRLDNGHFRTYKYSHIMRINFMRVKH